MRKAIYFLCFSLFLPVLAHAELSLSVLSVEGLNSIRFPRAENAAVNEQVRVRITGEGQRYQVKQRLLDDFRNDKGELLNRRALTCYTLSGSNMHGTLYQGIPTQVDSLDRVVYVSSPQGDNDSLVMVYQVDPLGSTASGNFFGRIIFTLQDTSGTNREQNVIINCYVTIDKKADFSIDTSSHNPHLLRILPSDSSAEGFVQINLSSIFGKQFEVTQTMEEPFRNEQGKTLPQDVVTTFLKSGTGTSFISAPTGLSQKVTRIYQSTPQGSPDTLTVVLRVNKEAFVKTSQGLFTARFAYAIESGGELIKRFPLTIQIEIPSIFQIEATPETRSGLVFTNIQPNTAAEKEVVLDITTNTNKPYAVVQRVSSPLVNETGDTIPQGQFKVTGFTLEGMPGTPIVSTKPVTQGDTTIFVSDPTGTPAKVGLRYSLEGSPNMRSGSYMMKISYALIEK